MCCILSCGRGLLCAIANTTVVVVSLLLPLLLLLVERMRPVMLVGTAGCGKTQLINGMTSTLDPNVRLSQTINMNFYTTSPVLQSTTIYKLNV